LDKERRPVGRPRKNREGPDDPREIRRVPDHQAPGKNVGMRLPDWDGKMRGPTLGRYNPEGREWHKLTLKWWKTWRSSPQAMFMTPTDWEALFLGAVMHDRMMKGVSDTALANLDNGVRRREDAVGASIEARLRLGMSPDKPNTDVQEAQVKKDAAEAIDYLTRLNKRVADDSS